MDLNAAFLSVLALGLCLTSGSRSVELPGGRQQSGVVPTAQAVDDARCVDCHPGQTQSWRLTGMGRALLGLDEIAAEELEGLSPVAAGETGFSYHFDAGGNSPKLVESYRSESAQPKQVNAWPLSFGIGAGDLDRSYAMAVNGRWWLAPLEVVSDHVTRESVQTLRHAALAPSHSMRPGTRASQPITPECLACHTEDLPPITWPLNTVAEAWKPSGISCGACHARATEHADWREDDLEGLDVEGQDPLLSHRGFTREERMSVCATCHLQGDARLELIPRRFAIPEPGGNLLDVRAVYVGAQPGSELGFASQTERLVLSRCYLESSAMSCETCHDPHRSVYEPRESARVRAACSSCHAATQGSQDRTALPCAMDLSARPASKDCADCHMAETPVFDVAGVRIHDHWIQRLPIVASEPKTLRFDEAPDGKWRRFRWPGIDPPKHIDDQGLLMMALASRGHGEQALALVDAKPSVATIRLPMYHHVKAGVLEAGGRLAQAERAYRVALALEPGLAAASVNLGLLLARTDRASEAVALLTPIVEAYPAYDSALRNRALAFAALGDEERFVRDLEKAFRLNPGAEVALALAQFFDGRGETSRAERWRAAALAAQPDF